MGFDNCGIKPHMSDCHPVLCQGTSLIRANGGCGTQSFYSFQVLNKAILGCHSLGSECQTHSHSSKKTLRYIGNNDTNQEHNSIQPMVSHNESNNEEGNSKEDSYGSNDVNEMGNFLGNWGFTRYQT